MRTRPDASQETLARRLALLRAEPSEDDVDEADWWGGHTSVTGEAGPAAVPIEAVVVPVPGRHAARRSAHPVPRLSGIPETLRGRVRLGPTQLIVVALVLVAALVLTCWWLARGRATALSAPMAVPSSAAPLSGLTSPDATTSVVAAGAAADKVLSDTAPSGATASVGASAGAMVTVDVEGKVRRPGIVILPTGSRVTDALKAAGGVPHRRALHGLNLAAVLTDAQQIMVGAAAATGGIPVGLAGESPNTTANTTVPVNLNTATADQLDALPDVGPVTAQSILEWRNQNGRFTSVRQLLDVDGIGPATLAKLTPHVTV